MNALTSLVAYLPSNTSWIVAALLLGYAVLVGIAACTAMFAQKPARRKAAMDVLRLVWPHGRAERPVRNSPKR